MPGHQELVKHTREEQYGQYQEERWSFESIDVPIYLDVVTCYSSACAEPQDFRSDSILQRMKETHLTSKSPYALTSNLESLQLSTTPKPTGYLDVVTCYSSACAEPQDFRSDSILQRMKETHLTSKSPYALTSNLESLQLSTTPKPTGDRHLKSKCMHHYFQSRPNLSALSSINSYAGLNTLLSFAPLSTFAFNAGFGWVSVVPPSEVYP